jgi:ribosomal protein S18 acetylase RimI-like enzyme
MAMVPWSSEQKEAFLRMQFDAQAQHYQEHFGDAEYSIVLLGSDPVGRLYLDRRADEIRVVDIALLPGHRGNGIGGELMWSVLAEGTASGKAVRIHVERNNRALSFYRRLGFRVIQDGDVYHLMEWLPGSPPGCAASP